MRQQRPDDSYNLCTTINNIYKTQQQSLYAPSDAPGKLGKSATGQKKQCQSQTDRTTSTAISAPGKPVHRQNIKLYKDNSLYKISTKKPQ
jgi:hypothetical protein